MPGVNSMMERKAGNVRHGRVSKIIADTRFLFVVKISPLFNVFSGFSEDYDRSHA